MSRYSKHTLDELVSQCKNAATATGKGEKLESLICYVFQKVPGVTLKERDAINASHSEEIDLLFWNKKSRKGLYFLPFMILSECKNWSSPVGSAEVAYFIQKLKHRGLDHGILIAANGITGSSAELTSAHSQISIALSEGVRVLVLTIDEINELFDSESLVLLLKEKLCKLTVSGTSLP